MFGQHAWEILNDQFDVGLHCSQFHHKVLDVALVQSNGLFCAHFKISMVRSDRCPNIYGDYRRAWSLVTLESVRSISYKKQRHKSACASAQSNLSLHRALSG